MALEKSVLESINNFSNNLQKSDQINFMTHCNCFREMCCIWNH